MKTMSFDWLQSKFCVFLSFCCTT